MAILIACEESQEVCKAFRERGFEAYSCDILKPSGGHPEWHILGDVLPLLDGDCCFTTMSGEEVKIDGKWDMIIAHPPCTYLSNAGACRMYRILDGKRYINEERFRQMLGGKEFFMAMLNADCDRIAVENPTPLKICELPAPTQAIQPYEYGHPYSKRMLLWLKGLPPLFPTDVLLNHTPYLPSNTSAFARGQGGGHGAVRGSKNYAKTFRGVAVAMAEQWGNELRRAEQ